VKSTTDEIVEPVEIIVDSSAEKSELWEPVNPVSRFLARMVDYAIFGLLWRYVFHLKVIPWFSIPLFVWVPFEALLLSFIGFTPGKWLLRIYVRDEKHKKLSLRKSLFRSLYVWMQGMGFGVNILYFLTMLTSFLN
jgi:hypothetical protein